MPLCNSVSSLPAGKQVCATLYNRKELIQSATEEAQRVTEIFSNNHSRSNSFIRAFVNKDHATGYIILFIVIKKDWF
jgi:hypothetical protein